MFHRILISILVNIHFHMSVCMLNMHRAMNTMFGVWNADSIICVLVRVMITGVNYRFDDDHFRVMCPKIKQNRGRQKFKFSWSWTHPDLFVFEFVLMMVKLSETNLRGNIWPMSNVQLFAQICKKPKMSSKLYIFAFIMLQDGVQVRVHGRSLFVITGCSMNS